MIVVEQGETLVRIALPAAFAREAEALAVRYGTPIERHAEVGSSDFWTSQTSNRDAEVCMVLRRANGHFLTFTKRFYPPGLYRLFTGGVERGETILHALLRETGEETGLAVTVGRFLAVVTYSLEDGPTEGGAVPCYATFAFLLDTPSGVPAVTVPDEPISGYREVTLDVLPAVADQLESLPDVYSQDLDCSWRVWGRFRAVIHRAVADAC